MSIIKTMWAMLCPALSGFFLLRFGGDSSSSSTTENKTYNTDSRVVGGNDSTNISAHNSGNISASGLSSVTTTDHGAVSGGLLLGSEAITASTKLAEQTNTTAGNMFAGALGALKNANESVAQAYQTGQAGEQTALKYAGFAVVGLAAVMLLPKIVKA